MNTAPLYEILRRLPNKTDLRLVGGEPTLRDDLPEIINSIVNLGHRPILITNGLRLADLSFSQSLKDARLRYIQLSMNGFKYDDIYRKIDNMACADLKLKAVENCRAVGIEASLSCILVRGINTHLVSEFIDFAESHAKPARINFRNVGAIGRNMSGKVESLTMKEMVDLVAEKTGLSSQAILKCKTADNQIRLLSKPKTRYSQQVIVKLTDWSVFQADSVADPKALVRGRVTQDFKLASHFEHVKENEFGY